MRYLVLALVLVAAPAEAQRRSDDCGRNWDNDRYERFCDERTIGWRGNRDPIAVDAGPNGGVTVTGWNRDSVNIVITVHAQGRTVEAARELAAQVTVRASNGVIRATGPSSRRGASWWVSYDISAPARSDLTLETENGPLEVSGVSGVLDLRAVNGPITLADVAGNVRARLDNGPLTVSLTGSSWTGQGLDAETRNGPVTIRIPDGYNAELETGTVNGPMDIGMPITVQGRFGGGQQRLRTTLGRGGPSVRAVTTNGPAVIRRIR